MTEGTGNSYRIPNEILNAPPTIQQQYVQDLMKMDIPWTDQQLNEKLDGYMAAFHTARLKYEDECMKKHAEAFAGQVWGINANQWEKIMTKKPRWHRRALKAVLGIPHAIWRRWGMAFGWALYREGDDVT